MAGWISWIMGGSVGPPPPPVLDLFADARTPLGPPGALDLFTDPHTTLGAPLPLQLFP
jgi:hypothetical protein